jgi:hypothetical protein
MIRPMNDEEIREEIAKAGGYEAYRRDALNYDKPIEAPQPVRKSEAEVAADYYTAIAKARGLSLGEFFKANPSEYQRYRELAYSR